jgi:DNA topoisomerase-1
MVPKWITRQRRGRGYTYTLAGLAISDKEQLTYIRQLRIPPGWQDVRIAVNRRSKILATGVDKAGRLQYIYDPAFRARQEQAKFERVLRFARALPHMRRIIDKDLQRRRLDYRKVMATIISIMDQTYIRVGNDSYARDNQSYGLTTLRSKHTTVAGNTITFDFMGKSGKHHVKRIRDSTLARIVRQLDNLPGYEVFKYYDETGALRDVKSTDVNSYIKEVMGEEFSAKDFRTWAGTLIASAELTLAERAASERERKKTVTACVKKVAKKLGNTPAIARASYIDPRIIKSFMDGEDLRKVRTTVETMKHQKGGRFLSPDERCVLSVLEKTAATKQ